MLTFVTHTNTRIMNANLDSHQNKLILTYVTFIFLFFII